MSTKEEYWCTDYWSEWGYQLGKVYGVQTTGSTSGTLHLELNMDNNQRYYYMYIP